MTTVRINKYLADEGFATRRGADELITSGKVLVNGVPAVLGQKVSHEDIVELVGHTPKKSTYLLYYKPKGVITHSPGEGETDIATKLQELYGVTGVFPVGRLDKHSEGLMLLTNDGRITKRILEPNMEHEKEYTVSVDKPVKPYFLKRLASGVNIEGYTTKPTKTKASTRNKNAFTIVLTEGKKHQIRRMCAALGYQVTSLKRVRILDLELGKLKPGQYRKLSKAEGRELLNTLGLR